MLRWETHTARPLPCPTLPNWPAYNTSPAPNAASSSPAAQSPIMHLNDHPAATPATDAARYRFLEQQWATPPTP
ncbi:MAG: hypothetical protein M3O02_13035 [Acidobacteriota bacterium]|nr:hypothetical protein [Acidobacteriota bacterium]